MKDPLRDYETELTGGLEQRKWHYLAAKEGGGSEAVLYFMGAEYDPVRVTYDLDGCVSINADGHSYFAFDADTLRWLADMVDEVEESVVSWMAGEAPDIEATWGKPDQFDDEEGGHAVDG